LRNRSGWIKKQYERWLETTMRQTILNTALFCLFALPALGQGATLTKTFNQCMDQHGNTTVEMQACIRAEYRHQDQRLNTDYRSLMAQLPSADRKQLRQSERTWLKQRQAKCEHAGDAEAGGTLQGVERGLCVVNETADRSVALERLLAKRH
jgi:uncharacterized protein YecT (DUF1311 family)